MPPPSRAKTLINDVFQIQIAEAADIDIVASVSPNDHRSSALDRELAISFHDSLALALSGKAAQAV